MYTQKRTILITGGTSGIGYKASIELIKSRNKLIIPCRNKNRQIQVIEKFNNDIAGFEHLRKNCLFPILDLSDLESIEEFSNDLLLKKECIDSLILNAGLQYTGSKSVMFSKQNIELSFAVNHLSHYFLANKLIELLLLSNSPKIIITASEVHNPLSPGGKVGIPAGLGKLRGLESGEGFKMVNGSLTFNADKAYKDSKLCNILFAKELSKRVISFKKKFPIICWAPGLIIPRSNEGFFRYSRKYNELGQRLFAFIARDILNITESCERAGQILMEIEQSVDYINESFVYLNNKLIGFNKHKLIKDNTSSESNDSFKQKKLWELSNNLINKYYDLKTYPLVQYF